MRSLFILFFLVMMCILAVAYVNSNNTCPPPVTEFRYINKTFDEEQSLPNPLLMQFRGMFEGPNPWIQTNDNARTGLT